MPFQRSTIDTIDHAPKPSRRIRCADIEFDAGPTSRRRPWLGTRFGYAGSAEGFDLLRFEAPAVALMPETAAAVIEERLIDAIVIEHAIDDLCSAWGMSFLDWTTASGPARILLRTAGEQGLPRIALMRGGPGQVPLFAPLASEVDHVVVTQPATATALKAQGIDCELVAPAMQPALYHGFGGAARTRRPSLGLLSLDLDRILEEPAVAEDLARLLPRGLDICSADLAIREVRLGGLGALAERFLGTTTPSQLRELLAASDVLIQFARNDRDCAAEIQHALHAAASRCAVAVVGGLAADDPRNAFAHAFPTIDELESLLDRLATDHAWAERQYQANWRAAHRNHAAASFARRLAEIAGQTVETIRRPMATVITPTFRPELLGRAIEQFRSQTWGDKELIVVANTDRPADWQEDLLDSSAGEQILYLPRRFGPGVALNLGAARARGDYVFRMDDDDHYGPHYVEDMMLGADAIWPDIMGKNAVYYHYIDEERVIWVPNSHRRPSRYPSASISQGGHLAGFTHVVRRDVFERVSYPHTVYAAADTGFLAQAEALGDLVCLRADGLNAVVVRRSDPRSHTWQDARTHDDPNHKDLSMSLEQFLE